MHRSRLFWAILGVAGALRLAPAQLYDFTVVAPPSGISGNLSISARTQGTLVGNYDQTNNPNGTPPSQDCSGRSIQRRMCLSM